MHPKPAQHANQWLHKELQLSSSLGWHHDHCGAYSLALEVNSHYFQPSSCSINYYRTTGQGLVLPLRHLCNFFFFFLNNQCRQISILLSWHQNEHLKVNKGLHLQSGSLCLRNKCLFSLSFVGSSDKSHFWTKDANWDISDGQLGNLMGKCEYPTPNLI